MPVRRTAPRRSGSGPGPGGVDWGALWRRAQRGRYNRPEAWDARAASFGRGGDGRFAEAVLRCLAPEPGWTALDVGSGPGVLAIPLARRLRQVTALDFSPAMLAELRARCAAEGVRNVTPVLGGWADDWAVLGVGAHDLAVASRSLTVPDLSGALRQLDGAARRRACVVAPVGDGPTDRRVLEAAGRRFRPGPDFFPVLAAVHAMGRLPRLDYVESAQARTFATRREALERMAWSVRGCTPAERRRLRAWLDRALVPGEGGFQLPGDRTVRWAVLWWDKEETA